MLIFKGTVNGRIVKRDMPGWDNTFLYACQLNAWMDERCMLLWVELCLKPHVATIPMGIIPIIFLDSYRCHMMASVVDAIQELGVEVEHIPGGVHVCVNRSMLESTNLSKNVYMIYGRHG